MIDNIMYINFLIKMSYHWKGFKTDKINLQCCGYIDDEDFEKVKNHFVVNESISINILTKIFETSVHFETVTHTNKFEEGPDLYARPNKYTGSSTDSTERFVPNSGEILLFFSKNEETTEDFSFLKDKRKLGFVKGKYYICHKYIIFNYQETLNSRKILNGINTLNITMNKLIDSINEMNIKRNLISFA